MKKTTVQVEFTIVGDDVITQDVSSILNIQPTSVVEKTEINQRTKKLNPTNSWSISSDKEFSDDVEIQMLSILKELKSKKNKIIEIKNKYNAEVNLCVLIKVYNNEKPAIGWNPEISLFLGEIGAEVYVEIYIM